MHARLTQQIPDDHPAEAIKFSVAKCAALLQLRKQHPLLGDCPALAQPLLKLCVMVADTAPALLSAIMRDFVLPSLGSGKSLPLELAEQLAQALPHLAPAVRQQVTDHIAQSHAHSAHSSKLTVLISALLCAPCSSTLAMLALVSSQDCRYGASRVSRH